MAETKKCRDCGRERDLSEFWWVREGQRRPECKECASATQRRKHDPQKKRRRDLMKRYGITPEEYDLMRASQAGTCAICAVATTLVVDHEHLTGRVRGLLCPACNQAIGLLGEDEERLRAAIAYLTR